jgi:hypothetical protein
MNEWMNEWMEKKNEQVHAFMNQIGMNKRNHG